MEQYIQHRIITTSGDKQDVYTFKENVLHVDFKSFIGFRDHILALPYSDIEEVRTKTSFWGWLMGYCDVIVKTEERDYRFEKVKDGKQMVNDLTDCIS